MHTDTGQTACHNSTGQLTGRVAVPDLDALVIDALPELADRYTLRWIDDHGPGLTGRQIAVLLDGRDEYEDPEFSAIHEDEDHAVWNSTNTILVELLGEDLYELLDRADRLDPLRDAVRDRDDSESLPRMLLEASPRALFRYDLGVDLPAHPISAQDRATTTKAIAQAAGLDLDHPPNAVMVASLIDNSFNGGRLFVLWYDKPAAAVKLAAPNVPDTARGTVTFTHAHLLVLDSWYGSGHDVAVPTITAAWSPRRVTIDAARAGDGYSWTEIALPVASAYAGTYRVDRDQNPAEPTPSEPGT